jgi:hypothetical protein
MTASYPPPGARNRGYRSPRRSQFDRVSGRQVAVQQILARDEAPVSASTVLRSTPCSPAAGTPTTSTSKSSATGADRGELLIIPDQPDTGTLSDHELLRKYAVMRSRSGVSEAPSADGHGVAGSLGARGDTELVIDVRQVPGHRPVADEQGRTDLTVGASVGHEREHLVLTRRQAVGQLAHRPARPQPLIDCLRPCPLRVGGGRVAERPVGLGEPDAGTGGIAATRSAAASAWSHAPRSN